MLTVVLDADRVDRAKPDPPLTLPLFLHFSLLTLLENNVRRPRLHDGKL